MIANDDMHLKNVSLQRLPDNRSRYYDKLTPNYDCLITRAFDNPSMMKPLALDLLVDEKNGVYSSSFEAHGYYTGSDFLELGRRLELREVPIKKVIQRIQSKEHELIALVERSFMPPGMIRRATALIKQRITAVTTGLD